MQGNSRAIELMYATSSKAVADGATIVTFVTVKSTSPFVIDYEGKSIKEDILILSPFMKPFTTKAVVDGAETTITLWNGARAGDRVVAIFSRSCGKFFLSHPVSMT